MERLKNTRCMSSTVYYVMYSVRYTLYTVQCTTYSVQCTLYRVKCAAYTNRGKSQSTIQCTPLTMYSVHCTLYIHCSLYSECLMVPSHLPGGNYQNSHWNIHSDKIHIFRCMSSGRNGIAFITIHNYYPRTATTTLHRYYYPTQLLPYTTTTLH